MERSVLKLLLLSSPCLAITIWPAFLSLAVGLPLPPNWSFSTDVSLNSPLPRNAHTAPSLSLFTPILSTRTFSSGKGFSLGFYSTFSPHATSSLPTSTFLTVCLGTNQTDSEGRNFVVPVWHFDRTRPLRQLQLDKAGFISLSVNSPSKDLILRNGDGNVVFSVSNVQAMELLDDGNWVLYDANQRVLWQSFDHPSDTLLIGQYLGVGMKLVSNNSLYTAEMRPGGLIFYLNSQASARLLYWAVPLNLSVLAYVKDNAFQLSKHPSFNITSSLESSGCDSSSPSTSPHPSLLHKPYALFQGINLTVQGDCSSFDWTAFSNIFQNNSFNSDFMVLSDDGYPRGYTFIRFRGKNVLFTAASDGGLCLIPLTCGRYGICREFVFSLQYSCHCPSVADNVEFKDAFDYNDPSNPAQGCHRTIPLRCPHDTSVDDTIKSTSLVEIKKSTLISIHPIFETTYAQNTFPLPECIDRCARNCSCSGFFYHSGQSFCLPFSDEGNAGDIPSATLLEIQSPQFSTYVKIQTSKAVNMEGSVAEKVSHSKRHFSMAGLLSIVLGTSALILAVGVFTIFKYIKRLKDLKEEDQVEAGDADLQRVLPSLPMRFSYKELYKITGGFSSKNWIGAGGFGSVYQGVLPDGRKVAVKQLDQGSPRLKQFLAEIAIIGGVSHCNIASLCGFCSQKSHRLLVYEYMENGSLDRWLFSDKKNSLLDWATRYQIALGTARGLAYLHEECPKPIIHFDVKPQNILLDKDFVAKISDFGMCKLLGKADSSCVMTGVRGTPGYLAPEWLAHSNVGKKCDVYSYGMVLFEIVGGRKNAVQALVGTEQWYLPSCAAVLWKEGMIGELVDKQLEGLYEEEQVRRLIHVAFLCIQRDPQVRPTMGRVYKMIEGSLALGEEEPPYDTALDPLLSPFLSPQRTCGSPSHGSCTSALLVGR